MKVSTAMNHLSRVSGRQAQCYYTARSSGLSHAALLDLLQKHVRSDPALSRCPSWVHTLLTERSQRLLADLYRPDLSADQAEHRDAELRAGRDVPRLAYLRWFLTDPSTGALVDRFDSLSDAGKELARTGTGIGSFRWNHKRGNVF